MNPIGLIPTCVDFVTQEVEGGDCVDSISLAACTKVDAFGQPITAELTLETGVERCVDLGGHNCSCEVVQPNPRIVNNVDVADCENMGIAK